MITITADGVERSITDIGVYRIDLANVERMLAAIYAGFDPNHPEWLLEREDEIVKLYNRRLDLKAIVDKWDDAERASANILAAWTVVEEIRKGDAS
jgi:hypothetical protein